MKRTAFLLLLVLFFSIQTVSAETNWVQQFLGRYRPAPIPSAPPTPADSMQTLVQNGAIPLTTAEVVHLLLVNNRDLIVNRLAPLSSSYSVETFFRPFEPNIHFGASVDRTKSPSRSQLIGAPALNQLTHNITVGVDQTLETGLAYSADFTMNRASSNSSFNLFNPSWAGSTTFAMTQSFLRNFGRNINRRQIRIAQNTEKISEIQFETQLITLISQAEESYWDLVFNRDNISVKRRALELAMKTQHDNETQVTVGSLAPIELVQSEAEVATRREDLITAQHTSQQLEDQVKKIISNSTDPGLVLARLDPTQAVADPSDQDLLPIEEGIRVALENRPEMRQTGYEIANRDVDVQFTKNQMLPSLDVTAKYTQSGLGGTRTISSGLGSAVVQVVPGGVGDVFTQLFGLDFPGYTLGFNVQIPISNRAAKADYSRAITEQKTANLRKDALAQQIALEVRNAYTQVDLNRARIETARVAHQLAIRRLDAEQKKFELGTSTVRFVLEEQRNLAQAETDEIEAKVNYAKSLVEYHRSIGNTLAKNNIEIDRELKQSPPASSK